MERKKTISYFVRFLSCFFAVFLIAAAFIVAPSPNAFALPANGTVDTTLTTPFPFDNIIWTNSSTSNNYYLSWALNDFTATGFNYPTEYYLGNNLLSYTTTPFVSDNASWIGSQGFMSSRLLFSHDARNAGAITLTASEFFINSNALSGEYLIAFGQYGEFPFTYSVHITYGIVTENADEYSISFSSTRFTGESLFTSDVVSMWSIDLCDILSEWASGFSGSNVYISQMDVVLRRVGNSSIGEVVNPSTADSHYMWISADVYSSSDSRLVGLDSWFDMQDISVNDGPVYVTEFPSNWTGWLGEAISGFMNFEFAPGLSIGLVFAAVFGVLILWFILHLFM